MGGVEYQFQGQVYVASMVINLLILIHLVIILNAM